MPQLKPPQYTLLKWLFGAVLGSLFIVGVITQMQQSTGGREEGRTKIVDIKQQDAPPVSKDYKTAEAMKHLASTDENERVAGMESMMIIDPVAGGPVVLGMMSDVSALVRKSAIRIAQAYKISGGGGQLAQMLSDADAEVRSAALASIVNFSSEPGLAGRLMPALTSPQPEILSAGVSAWKSIFPKDRSGSLAAIQIVLSSNNEPVIADVLGFLQSQLKSQEKDALRGTLMSIQGRFGGSSAGAMASTILGSTPGGG